MKKISILAAGLLLASGAMAQKTFRSKPTMLGNQATERREKSRERALQLMSARTSTANKSTAAYERMIGFTDYGMNQSNVLAIQDSGALVYSGMKGSSYDYDQMSTGYFSPILGAMMPDNKLLYLADDFKIYLNNNQSSLYVTYTITYDNSDNVTEMYLDYAGSNPDERVLMTYGNNKMTYAEMLTQNGSNWDTTYRRYFNYDSNNMLVEDSVMRNQNNVWSIYQKFEYNHDMNGNVTFLRWSDLDNMNNIFLPYSEDYYTYNSNDQMETATYWYYDENTSTMLLDSKDSFEYVSGVDFFVKDNYSMWDEPNTAWEPYGMMEKHLNTNMKPDTAAVSLWNGTAWEPYYFDAYTYNSFGNPIHDSLWSYTNQTVDEDPSYVGHFYYQTYFDLHVGNTNKLLDVNVYPNPATNVLNVTTTEGGALQLQLFNNLGQVVRTARSSGNAKMGISDLAPGTYWLSVTDSKGGTPYRQMIVKQ
jgi:hypothetical protein